MIAPIHPQTQQEKKKIKKQTKKTMKETIIKDMNVLNILALLKQKHTE